MQYGSSQFEGNFKVEFSGLFLRGFVEIIWSQLID